MEAGPPLLYAESMTPALRLLQLLLLSISALAFAEPPPVRIGVIESLTGLAAEDGQNAARALQLAAEDLRSAGAAIELLVEDDKSSPRETVTAYQKLRAAGVDAMVVGPYSYTTESILPIAGRDRMVVLNSGGLLESFEAGSARGYFFNNTITIAEDSKPFRAFLAERPCKSAVILHVPSGWGGVQRQAYSGILAEYKVRLIESIETPAQDNNDWGALLTRIAAQKPDLLVLLLNKADIDVILRESAARSFRPLFFGSKNSYDAWRLSREAPLYSGLCFTYPYRQLLDNRDFARRFEERFGEEPRIFADVSYDAARILYEGVSASRASGRPLEAVLRSGVFKGVVGEYRFTPESSLAVSRSSLVCVDNRELKLH